MPISSPLPIRTINTANVQRIPLETVLQTGYQSIAQGNRSNVSPIPQGGSFLLEIPFPAS
jgi:hypothetical protein